MSSAEGKGITLSFRIDDTEAVHCINFWIAQCPAFRSIGDQKPWDTDGVIDDPLRVSFPTGRSGFYKRRCRLKGRLFRRSDNESQYVRRLLAVEVNPFPPRIIGRNRPDFAFIGQRNSGDIDRMHIFQLLTMSFHGKFLFPIPDMEAWNTQETDGKTQEDFIRMLGTDKDRIIVVYCGFVKCTRSHNGAAWAVKLGYKHVYRYSGGIYAWKGAKYPLEKVE